VTRARRGAMTSSDDASLFLACPAALAVLAGPVRRHLSVNPSYAALAAERGAPGGRTLAEVWPEAGPALEAALSRAPAAGGGTPASEVTVEVQGARGPAWLAFSFVRLADGPGGLERILVTATEATGQVRVAQAAMQLQARLEEERGRLRLIQELSEALSGARTRQDVARIVFEQGLAVLGASAGALLLPRPGVPDELEIVEQFGYPEPLIGAWRFVPLALDAPATAAVRLGAPVWVASRQEAQARFPAWAPAVLAGRDQAWAGLPLVVGGRVLGALGLTWYEARGFEAGDQRLLLSVATRCAQALDQAEAHDEAERRAAELRAVLEAVPIPIFVASDTAGARIVGNKAGQALLGLPDGANASLRSPAGQRPPYVPVRGDVPVPVEELPMQVAARQGKEVEGMALDLLRPGGDRRHVVASARPIVDASGARRGAVGAFVDVTEHVRSEAALRESEAILRGILNATSESIWLFSVDGVALAANQTALARWGGPPDQILGRRLLDLLPQEMARSRAARLQEVARTGQPVQFEDVRAGIHFEHTFFPVPGADGRVGRVAVFSRDVTAQRRAEAALREADRRKDDFLGLLSHELRNPLAPIRNSLYLLEHGDPAGAQAARARGVIRRQADHMARLVDDLLDVTRIAHGRIELRKAPTDLRDLVARTAEDLRSVAEGRGAALEVILPAQAAWAEVDAVRIAQVLGNLLQNAAKFSRKGDRIEVALRALDGQAAAELSVRDTGAGIDPAFLPEIFAPFSQGSRTLARSDGGLGLGLALVKGLVEQHGGSVRAESGGVGQGATFTVRLPLAATATAGAAPPAAGEPASRWRVLVVDDNRDGADTLAEVVVLLGHEVEVAYDGPSAIEKARAIRPDVVLCDIGLPGLSGYEVARALRSADGPRALIALTGYAQPEDVQRALDAGFTGHLAKPVDLDVIERVLGAVAT